MKLQLVCLSLFIHLLILQVAGQSDSLPKESNVLRLHSMDFREENDLERKGIKNDLHNHVHGHSASSHMDHMDPSTIVFFFLEDLKIGKTMPIYFPDRDLSSSHFLPKEEADTIPFSLNQLPQLLRLLSFPQGSPQAIAMEDTLRECETKPIKGEIKICATSIASMFDFALRIFGLDNISKIEVLSTNHLTKLTIPLQKYTITEVPRRILSPRIVACHTMPYPYGVLYCHYQESETRVFKVSMVSEQVDKVEAIAVCHMDTSQWGRNHVSFRVLRIEPGTSPVCHFFPADNLVLIPSNST